MIKTIKIISFFPSSLAITITTPYITFLLLSTFYMGRRRENCGWLSASKSTLTAFSTFTFTVNIRVVDVRVSCVSIRIVVFPPATVAQAQEDLFLIKIN